MKTVLSAITFIFECFLLTIVAFLFDLTQPIKTDSALSIPKGSATKIITELSKKNVNFTIFDPKILARLGVVKQGEVELEKQIYPKIDFLHALTTAKPAMMHVTLIPGETTILSLKEIAKKNNFKFETLEAEYNATAPFYEGFLFADTYSFAKGLDEKQLIQNLVEISKSKHEELKKELKFDGNESAWSEILTKASIIQKEVAGVEEYPIVASVIENRLKLGMKLEMDGTLNYGEFSHVKVTPERIRNDKSKFNTYLNDGIPESAICIASTDAVKAVLNPAQTEFLYFMRDKRTGKHDFAKTYNEHLKNVNTQKRLK